MRTKFLLLAFLSSVLVSASAQQYQPQVGFSTENGQKVNFKKNKTGDNWFISLGGGASMLFGDQNEEAEFGERINWAAGLSVGKWYNPYFAFRLQVNGGQLKDYQNLIVGGAQALTLKDFYYGNAHLDFMWDITNYWAPYNEKKLFRFIPFAGAGYALRPGKTVSGFAFKRSESPSINLGAQIPIRLSERIDLFLEGEYSIYNENFNRALNAGQVEDRVFQGLIGLNFKIGRTNFEVIEPMDYDLLNDLNSQINALRAQNDELSKRPKSCPECPKVAPVVESIESLKNVVFFRLNSSVIDKNQEGNIFNTSEYAKKHNLPVKVVGFADKQTGTADYNYGLSERRAKAVAKRLNEAYGIPTEKISIEWKGDTQQPYEINNWNRVVIMDTNK